MTSSTAKRISITIPTFNRPDFIARLLHYYAETQFKGVLLIGDSSNTNHIEQTKKIIAQFKEKLCIEYHLCPNMSEPETSVALILKVETPYVAWLPDDDFLLPRGLVQCATFLEENPDYSVAYGTSAMIILEKTGPFGKLHSAGPYGGARDVPHEKAQHRLLNHFSNYFVLSFGLHRTPQMKEAYSRIADVADKGVAEILATCFFVLQGKIKALDCLYLVRQGHDQRYLLPDIYDWVLRSDWFSSYQIFYDQLSTKLAQQDGISKKEASEVVKRAFWLYLANGFSSRWRCRYAVNYSEKDAAKNILKNVPGARQLWQQMRSFLPAGKFSLPALLRKTSPYHNDFMPILHSVTTPPSLLP